MKYHVLSLGALAWLSSCNPVVTESEQTPMPGEGATIFAAASVVTMTEDVGDAVAVRDGRIVAIGARDVLIDQLPGAALDEGFADKTIIPGLIDPHVHMGLSSLQYATPLTPPWPMATPTGMVRGLPTRDAFFQRLTEIEAEAPDGEPLIVYGFHNLVHGDLVKSDLDAVTVDRPPTHFFLRTLFEPTLAQHNCLTVLDDHHSLG